jgi:hypothetical protein
MQPITSTRPSSASTWCNLHDDAMCTICSASPLILRPDWKTLAWLASRWSKPPDLDACPAPSSSSCRFYGATDKLYPAWFWEPNQEIIVVILRHKSPNRSCQFWGPKWKTCSHQFWGQTGRNCQPWFWSQIKKLALLVSLCTVQIEHSVTRPTTPRLPPRQATLGSMEAHRPSGTEHSHPHRARDVPTTMSHPLLVAGHLRWELV